MLKTGQYVKVDHQQQQDKVMDMLKGIEKFTKELNEIKDK